MQNHKWIFITGLHRSGTSILYRCILEHPQISGFQNTNSPEDEGQHLQSVFPTAWELGGPGYFGFNPKSHLTETSPLVTESNIARLIDEWSPFLDTSRPYLLEKSPPTLVRTRFFQKIFPDSYFISITRHPVVTALATKKMARKRRTLSTLIAHWFHCHDLFHSDAKFLKNSCEIHYEDFVNAPNRTLCEIFKFLDLQPINASLEIKTGINDKYLNHWKTLSRHPFFRYVITRLRRKFADNCSEYGYTMP